MHAARRQRRRSRSPRSGSRDADDPGRWPRSSVPVYGRTLSGSGCPDCYRLTASARSAEGTRRARSARDSAALVKVIDLPA